MGKRFWIIHPPTIILLWIFLLMTACTISTPTLSPVFTQAPALARTLTPKHTPPTTGLPGDAPEALEPALGLSADEIATLSSLEKVDDHPLYSMRYYGPYERPETALPAGASGPVWACSLFAAMADPGNMLYGRNFDWQHSPAVLLFTDPADRYASVSMVDIAYLGFDGQDSQNLLDLSLSERVALLSAPLLPFDGMNEHGLVVGMAAVPPGGMRPDPQKTTIGSLGIIRQILDRARSVGEAVAIFEEFNIDFAGGPPIHYLVADRSGEAALVEFYQGEMVVTPNQDPWHQATNFLRASVQGSPEGECWRYDHITRRLEENQGKLTPAAAMELLAEVSQENTQWSIVYDFGSGGVQVSMGRSYENTHTFQPGIAAP
jgi:hypothetical protein